MTSKVLDIQVRPAGESQHLSYTLNRQQRIKFNYRLSKILNLAREVRGVLGTVAPSAVDLGCGRGEILQGLKELGYSTYGMDIDPVCVRMSSEYGHVVRGDLLEIEKLFKGKKFDLIITSHALEHMQNPLAVLKGMRSIMAGYAIIVVPNVFYSSNLLRQGILGQRPPTNPGHLYEWDASNFENLVTNHAGLKIISWHADWVKMVPFRGLRRFADKLGVLRPLESRVAPRFLPHLAESLIVLCTR